LALLNLMRFTEAHCPGFGQDRVNFHQNPGRDTARRADPTWPNRIGYTIPCAVMLCSSGGELGGGNSLSGGELAAAVVEGGSLGCTLLCCVFSLCVSLLLLFPSFVVLLNCPYPNPPASACFFPFSSAPRQGEGWPHGAFVASHSQTITLTSPSCPGSSGWHPILLTSQLHHTA